MKNKSPLENLDSFKKVHPTRAKGVTRPYTLVCLPTHLAEQLKPLAKAEGRSLSNLVQRLAIEFLDFSHEQKNQD